MQRLRVTAPALAGPALAALLLTGCTGEPSAAEPSPEPSVLDAAGLLELSQETLAATGSVHYVLTSSDVPEGVTALLGGEGDAARPDSFAGELDVVLAGLEASVAVISVDGTLYAQLPFATGYSATDPGTIGIADPGELLAEDGGIDLLLGSATVPVEGPEARVAETVVRQVEVALPAAAVADVLTAADAEGEFTATLGIDPETGRLLRAELVGPFLDPAADSTYVIELSAYDEPVEITAPGP